MQKNHGFIFLSVLIFLQIFSLLGLYERLNLSDQLKKMRHQQQRQTNLQFAQYIMRRKINELSLTKFPCYITTIPAKELATKPLFWWKQTACTGNLQKKRYYYVLEELGNDPCASIDNAKLNLIAHYIRMTLYLLTDQIESAPMIIQSTIALSDQSNAICQGAFHRVKTGRQMWREI